MSSQFLCSKPSWKPHMYQKRAISLLLSQASGGLFLDPGLGKTAITLATYLILKQQGLVGKMLVVAPLRPVYKVWPDEIAKWDEFESLTYSILHGPTKTTALRDDSDIHIINPEGLLWLLDPKQNRPQYDVLCLDESSKFKDTGTKRFKLLKTLLPSFKRRWILTGTPAPNGIEDLFGQIYVLDLGRSLGRYITHFRNLYFQRVGYNLYDWRPAPGAFEEIVEKISPLILQLSAEDYLEMPELVYRNVTVSLPDDVRKVYKEVEDEFISRLETADLVAANAAVAGGKCRQIANGAVYVEGKEYVTLHDEKLDALESILSEFNGAPTIIFYEFEHDKNRILERFPELPVLGGSISPKKLDELVDAFNAGLIPALLGHPASMGHGLNLQGVCNRVVWFGITWNLEYYDQAIARIYRQGQNSAHVFVYHIVAVDTKDEDVLKVLTSKDRTQQNLLTALGKTVHEGVDTV